MKSFLRTIIFFIYFLSFSVNSQSILPAKKSSEAELNGDLYAKDSNDFFIGFDLALGTKSAHLNVINIGYKFNQDIGITSTFGTSLELFKKNDISPASHTDDNDSNITGLVYVSIGPIINKSFGNINWEFKPQYLYGRIFGSFPDTLSLGAQGNYPNASFEITESSGGNGFIIGNTFVKNLNKRNRSTGFRFVINIDYIKYITGGNLLGEYRYGTSSQVIGTSSKIVKIDMIRAGFGIRYNF